VATIEDFEKLITHFEGVTVQSDRVDSCCSGRLHRVYGRRKMLSDNLSTRRLEVYVLLECCHQLVTSLLVKQDNNCHTSVTTNI
jgi:hypothetical protein